MGIQIAEMKKLDFQKLDLYLYIQAWIGQLVAHPLVTMEVVGSNPSKDEDFYKNLNLNADQKCTRSET